MCPHHTSLIPSCKRWVVHDSWRWVNYENRPFSLFVPVWQILGTTLGPTQTSLSLVGSLFLHWGCLPEVNFTLFYSGVCLLSWLVSVVLRKYCLDSGLRCGGLKNHPGWAVLSGGRTAGGVPAGSSSQKTLGHWWHDNRGSRTDVTGRRRRCTRRNSKRTTLLRVAPQRAVGNVCVTAFRSETCPGTQVLNPQGYQRVTTVNGCPIPDWVVPRTTFSHPPFSCLPTFSLSLI